ncbi:Zn-ribbon domain-containing OB-fold protein, partial [Thermodesulfobacteriota bacterium]
PLLDQFRISLTGILVIHEWVEASGRGKVFAFNIHQIAFDPAFQDDIPYVYALIELEEGPLSGSNVIGCGVDEVKVGMPVEVVYEDITEAYTLPKFQPIN